VNRGHTTGECHTTGMRDPAQYLDASRNATMNANAAR
ncbi:conditioned medium factor domain protein, partial [Pantoea dispersa]